MSFLGKISAWLVATLAPYGGFGLMVVAICDSSFISLPEVNDAALMALSIQSPHRMWELAGLTTLGSVIGCLLLYTVGRKGGEALLRKRFSDDRVRRIQTWYQKYGVLAVLVPSLLPPPLPFKIFVLSAGAFKVSWLKFILAVSIGRGIRYFTEAILAVIYGKAAIQFVAQNSGKFGIALASLIIAGTMIYLYSKRKSANAKAYIFPFLLVMALGSGCVKNRTLSVQERMLASHPFSRSEALRKLEQMSNAVQNLASPVTIEAKLGGLKSASEKAYPPLSGTLIFQRPNNIRIQATFLTVGAFDMVSNGDKYQALIPWENKLFEGRELGPPIGAIFPNALHNLLAELRPRQIKSALLVDILPYLNNRNILNVPETIPTPQDRRRYYVVDFIDNASPDPQMVEKIWFDLSTPGLDISRRMVFGKDGAIETDVRFSGWQTVGAGSIPLPSIVDIQFPDKDLSVKLTLDPQKVSLNGEISADAFQLPPHADAEVILLQPKQAANQQ